MHLSTPQTIAEIQECFGSLALSEQVLQRVWLNQDFNCRHLTTSAGDPIRVLAPGSWDRSGGPEFKGARFQIGAEKISGDVVFHRHPAGWVSSGRSKQAAFSNTSLLVTLFDGPVVEAEPPHRLVLFPYLEEDLEGLLLRYLVEGMEERGLKSPDPWVQGFLNPPDAERQHMVLLHKAILRWDQRLAHAFRRLDHGSWDQVCHEMVLEVLGYRRNRLPMHQIAVQFPIQGAGKRFHAVEAFHSQINRWKLRGSRPANHPLKRLQGYAKVLQLRPEWPRHFLEKSLLHFMQVDALGESVTLGQMRRLRAHLGTAEWLTYLQDDLFAGEFSGSRIHTVIAEALIPLLAAKTDLDLFSLWYLWQPGDCPDPMLAIMRESAIVSANGSVQCNGWVQGLIQLGFESDSAL
jgi:hypothetical protein